MVNRNVIRTVALGGVALLGLSVTACSGNDSGSGTASSTVSGDGAAPSSTAPSSSAPATQTGGVSGAPTSEGTTSGGGSSGGGSATSTGSSAAAGGGDVAACTSSKLRVSVAQGDSGAGSTGYRIRFQNSSGSPCRIDGYPGVSAVGKGNGSELGKPADRVSQKAAPAVLIPNGSAYATLQAVNIGSNGGPLGSSCKVGDADGWRIYPPNETHAVYVKQPGLKACTSQTSWLRISPVHPAS